MSPVIENFVTAVNQAIKETIADYDRREATRRNEAVNAPQVTDGLSIIRDPEEIFEPEAEARRAATINAACDALLRQATINVERTDRYDNGVTARHEVTIATQDGGAACAMIHWGEDHMDFWPEGRPQQDWHEGRIVWNPWGKAGMTLFERMEEAITRNYRPRPHCRRRTAGQGGPSPKE